jgi:hypothetical protein
LLHCASLAIRAIVWRALAFATLAVLFALFGSPTISAQLREAPEESCSPANAVADHSQKSHPKLFVEDVRFDGPTHLPYSELQRVIEEVNQREMDAENPGWLDEFAEIGLRGAWQDRGYFNVKVAAKAKSLGGDSERERFVVTAHVDEGLQYRLGQIRFVDGTAFPADTLRNLIPMNDGDLFDVSKVREGIQVLTKMYASHGYVDFTAVPNTEFADRPQLISLVMRLDEQKQYRIGRISVVGAAPEIESVLRSRFKQGDVVHPPAVEEFYKEYKSALPSGAMPEDVQIKRHVRDGTADLSFVFLPFGAVEGVVLDSSGHPVQHASVYYQYMEEPSQVRDGQVETDCSGQFVIDHVLPRRIEIRARKESVFYTDTLLGSYAQPNEPEFPQVQVVADESVKGVIVRLGRQGGLLRVRVLDADTKGPLGGIGYRLCRTDNLRGLSSCAAGGKPGEFHLVVPSAPITLKIGADNYEDWNYRDEGTGSPLLQLDPGEAKSLTVYLKRKNPGN